VDALNANATLGATITGFGYSEGSTAMVINAGPDAGVQPVPFGGGLNLDGEYSMEASVKFNSGSPETRPVNSAVRYLIRALP
jgi:hypothetical protein